MKFPDFNRSESNSNGYTPYISQNSPSVSIGEGLSDLGKSLQSASNIGVQAYLETKKQSKEKQDQFDKQQAIRVFSEYQIALEKNNEDFKGSYADSPSDFYDKSIANQKNFFFNYQTEPMSDNALNHFNSLVGQNHVKQSAEALTYQAGLKGVQARSNIEEASSNLINNTRFNPYTNYWDNNQKIEDLMSSMRGLLPSDKLSEYRTKLLDQNAIAMIRGKADKNPRQTLSEINNGVYNSIVSPNALDIVQGGLKNEIEAEDKQLQNQIKQEIASTMNDHYRSLLQSNTSVLTLQQVEATQDPKLIEAFKFYDKVGKLGYAALKGSEGLPLDEQIKKIDSLKPKPGSKNYASEEQVYDALKSTIIEQNKQYMEDKVEASLSNEQVAAAYNRSHSEGIKATVAYQLNKGTSFHNIQIASKEEINSEAEKINGMLDQNNFDQAKAYLSELKSTYDVVHLPDGRSGWDIFKNQLKNNKGNKVADDFLLALQYQDIPEGNEIFQAYKTKLSDFNSLLDGTQIKQRDRFLDSSFSQYSGVISKIPGFAGSTQLALEKNLLSKYSSYLMTKGVPANEAVSRAFKTMYPYNIINSNNTKLIIPRNIGNIQINSSKINSKISELNNTDRIYSFLSQGVNEQGKQSFSLSTLSVKNNLNGQSLQLRFDAAQAFENAQLAMKQLHSKGILVNSAVRSDEEQASLYKKFLSGGPTAAPPGRSNHAKTKGLAIDVENYAQAKPFLEANGFVHRPYKNDPWHFEYVGTTYNYIENIPKRLSDESERKRYSDSLSKQGMWLSSPDLRSVTLYSKNNDGSITPVYNGNRKPYTFSLVGLQNDSKLPAIQYSLSSMNNLKKPLITKGSVQEKRAKNARNLASQYAGRPIYSDAEAAFINERGF